MASNFREVCFATRKFLDSIPPERIFVPVGLRDPLLLHIAKLRSSADRQFEIKLDRKTWGHAQLKGMMHRYHDYAEILYSVTLNVCWTRFVVCKEAAHLLIDTKNKHFTHNPVELIQQLIIGAPSLSADESSYHSEQLATFAAIEMLLPWPLRPEILKMVKSGCSDLEIARRFLVPEDIVNYSARSRYWDVSDRCHREYVHK